MSRLKEIDLFGLVGVDGIATIFTVLFVALVLPPFTVPLAVMLPSALSSVARAWAAPPQLSTVYVGGGD
jgi:hypothetical protein